MAQRAPFTRDEPIGLTEDAFGHRDYTDTLLSIVNDASPPPTIGLFGPWGVGKSTIIGGLQEGLAGTDAAFVYFDAWRYDGDPLRRQFLIEAANQLKAGGHLPLSYKPAVELDELHVDKSAIKESLGLSWSRLWKAAVFGVLTGLVVLALIQLNVINKLLDGEFGTEVLVSVVAFTVGTFAGLISQAIVVRPTTVSHKALQDPDRFAEKFRNLLNVVKPDRMVVAIDNLDRCSPEKAVEMLGTIKTYLEPAVGGDSPPRSSAHAAVPKEVVFVIAVDEAALRRHLLAQEAERSGQDDVYALRRYVDDYLAKFFSARLPIRPILADDMRDYIAAHLKPLVSARGIDESDAQELTSVLAVGFKRTPRGVKQFSNDLESRLRLLEEREREIDRRPAGISPAVSGEVGMVAKLALIESEWPEAFERLLAEPRLLAGWEEEAIAGPEVNWDGEEAAEGAEAGEDLRQRRARQDFAAFLRQGRSIKSEQLAALLKLKQSASEVAQGFSEFRAAVIGSDRARLEELLGEERETGKLAAQLPTVLREEVDAEYWVNARAVIDMAVSVPALAEHGGLRTEILTFAVGDPRLRREVALLDPTTVLGFAESLDLPDRRRLIDPFVARFADRDNDPDARHTIAEALVPLVAVLEARQRERIRHANAELPTEFGVYRPLAEADPKLISSGVAAAAIQTLAEPVADEEGSGQHLSLLGVPDALALARLAFANFSQPDVEAAAIAHVSNVLAGDPENAKLGPEIETARWLLDPVDGAPPENWSRILEAIANSWGPRPPEVQAPLLEFLAEFLDRASPELQETIPPQLLSTIFEHPARALDLIGDLGALPDSFRQVLIEQLVRVAATMPHQSVAAIEALVELVGDEQPQPLAEAAIQMIAAGQEELAAELLDDREEMLEPEFARIAEAAIPHLVERLAANQVLDGALLIVLVPAMSEERREVLGRAMADNLSHGLDSSALPIAAYLRTHRDADLRSRFVRPVLSGLLGLDAISSDNQGQLTALCANFDLLDVSQQAELASWLSGRLDEQPGQRLWIANTLAKAEGLAPEPAHTLVEGLIGAERAEGNDQQGRTAMLTAARAIRGGPSSRATTALRKRLGELRGGDSFEHDLARDLAV